MKYQNKFKKLLEQEDIQPPEAVNPEDDAAAFDGSFEGDVGADDFSVDTTGLSGLRSKHMARFQEIIDKFEEFTKYCNGDNEDSVNNFLNAVDRDGSIFAGVSRETSKVTTVAESLAALAEALRGYVLTGQRKQREQEAALAEY